MYSSSPAFSMFLAAIEIIFLFVSYPLISFLILKRPFCFLLWASSNKSFQIVLSNCFQFKKPKSSRAIPGAISAAIIAPSMRNVPLPHIGSNKKPPDSDISCHLDLARIREAKFSFNGAVPCPSL